MKTVAFTTLGCRVNRYDTDAMRGLFLQDGYEVVAFEEQADVYVINTCSVTNMGEKKSRQLIRQAKRRNPEAYVVVTGCYAQLDPETIAAIEGVNLVIGTSQRGKIVSLVNQLASTEETINAVHNIMEEGKFEELQLMGNEVEKTRAFMKIQEGCNNYCSFCIIPYTRGKLKSRNIDDIYKEACRLVEHGYKEIVLTGIHLGNYGLETHGKSQLAEVIRRLLDIEGLARIRMGSIESVEISEDIIELMATNPRVCPHLHLPLQAGEDSVLKAMNRHYTVAEFTALVDSLYERIPRLAITTDIIAGFPGESDESFATTLETAERIGFTHIHAFPYSIREGTPAATMDGQVPEVIKKTRVALLNELGSRMHDAFTKKLLGKEVDILVEKVENGWALGFTSEYIHGKIEMNDKNIESGDIVKGLVYDRDEDGVLVRPIA